MIPVLQTRFTDLRTGQMGNCFQACLASLLEIDIRRVPSLASRHKSTFMRSLAIFLSYHGCEFKGLGHVGDLHLHPGEGLDGFFIVAGHLVQHPADCRHILHCAIWKGGEVVFDPRPPHLGLSSIAHFYRIERAKNPQVLVAVRDRLVSRIRRTSPNGSLSMSSVGPQWRRSGE